MKRHHIINQNTDREAFAVPAFRDAILKQGLKPPKTFRLGVVERFPGKDKSTGNTAGWCKLLTTEHGVFGDWSTGQKSQWIENQDSLSSSELKPRRQELQAAQREAEGERESNLRAVAKHVQAALKGYKPADKNHPYLCQKKIQPHGTLQDKWGKLIISLCDTDSKIWSWQTIDGKGQKRFRKGGRKKGLFYQIGKHDSKGTCLVCEGFATGASLHEETGYPVTVAFDTGNLLPVCIALREKFPDVDIVLCADNDLKTKGNPGVTKATEAAKVVGGRLAIPDYPHGTDFNDLIVELKSQGEQPAERIKAIVNKATVVERSAADPDMLDTLIQYCGYIQAGDLVYDLRKPPHLCVCKLSEFKNRHAGALGYDEEGELTLAIRQWLPHPSRQTAEGLDYAPGKERLFNDAHGLRWLNEFYMPPFPKTTTEDKLGEFHDHMDYLFPIGDEREWFKGWLAFNLQHPELRCKVTPLHVSVLHGTGRGWVVELIGHLLGKHNVAKTSIKNMVHGDFHSYLNKTLVCAIEEVKEGNNRFAIADEMRDKLTENELEVNLKYGRQQTMTVHTNFFLMTNHRDALVLPSEDRRINVLSGPDKPKDRAYYDRLYLWLENTEALAQLHAWLLRLDLSKFNFQRSMETQARTDMIKGAFSETESLFLDLLDSPPFPAIHKSQIVKTMTEQTHGAVEINEQQLTKLLQKYAHSHKVKSSGKSVNVWCFQKNMTPAMMAKSYRAAEKQYPLPPKRY